MIHNLHKFVLILTSNLETVGAFEMNKILSNHIFKPEEVGQSTGGIQLKSSATQEEVVSSESSSES